MKKMPKDFLWGAAIAAHQCEGAWIQGGKGPAIMDYVRQGNKQTARIVDETIQPSHIYPSSYGVDFYHHYKADIALLAGMNLKSLRLSIDWSRIFPKGDEEEPNKKGLAYYHAIIDELRKYKIEPIVTICHFEIPMHLVKTYGSWKLREMIQYYVRYATLLFNEFKGKVKYWIAFNEINHMLRNSDNAKVISYMVTGVKDEDDKSVIAQMGYHMLLAVAEITKIAHAVDSNNQVGCVIACKPAYPLTCSPEDALLSFQDMDTNLYLSDTLCYGKFPQYKLIQYENEGISLQIKAEDSTTFANGTIDFVAFNYYSSSVVGEHPQGDESYFGGLKNPYLTSTDWGWQIDAIGLRYTMNVLHRRYLKPIMISENGFGAEDELVDGAVHDANRIAYLAQHIDQIKKAIVFDGVDCIGYQVWSAFDLVSATTGEMKKRYGFIYVDQNDTFTGSNKRYTKDSYDWYKKVIASEGEDII